MKALLWIGVLAFILTGCGSENDSSLVKLKFNSNEPVSKIEIQYGSTGKVVELLKEEDIKSILNMISEASFKKKDNQEDISGYMYRVTIHVSDRKEIITVISDDLIIIDSYYYNSSKNLVDSISQFLRDR